MSLLVEDSLGEDDVELDNQVASWTVSFSLQLVCSVSDYISSESSGHSFTSDAKLGLRSDHIVRCHKHLSIIKCVHSDWLHLQGFDQTERVSVYKIIALSLKLVKRHLLELDDKV